MCISHDIRKIQPVLGHIWAIKKKKKENEICFQCHEMPYFCPLFLFNSVLQLVTSYYSCVSNTNVIYGLYSYYYFCTVVAMEINAWVPCGQRWVANLDCYVRWGLFREWWVTCKAQIFTCLFCKGWSNSCLFFSFLRSRKVCDSFLDKRYLACVNTNQYKCKKFQFYFLLFVWITSQNTIDFWTEREWLISISHGSLLMWTRLFDLEDWNLLLVAYLYWWLNTLWLDLRDISFLPKILCHNSTKLSRINFKGWLLSCLGFVFYFVSVCGLDVDFVYLFVKLHSYLFDLIRSYFYIFLHLKLVLNQVVYVPLI